jgi:uncharacterized protein YcbK (DUF882 family)
MITRKEILMGRDTAYPLSPQLEDNLNKLLRAVNLVRAAYGKPMTVSSGYRPGTYNVKAGGAQLSAHLFCMACDFSDADGQLAAWCLAHLSLLEQAGLWMENPERTKGWVHLDIRPRKKRVFDP